MTLSPRERIARGLYKAAMREEHTPLTHRPVIVRAADLEAVLRECPPCDGTAFDVDDEDTPAQYGGRP